MRLTMPDPLTLERVRRAALLDLFRRGWHLNELPALMSAPVDDVLDRIFEHCEVLRVRVSDSETLVISSGRGMSVQ